ncbi:MAG: ImmA/IrrE family metallo-endopeptidase [Alphaproteobacteria bacterium]|nr:ImmA/IrrE family metallo-endopeptidase [Alphaproteobacteria bacterium]
MAKAPGRTRRKLFLGPQIRRRRRELGLTQAEMAAGLDLSPSYVNLLERNQRPVSAEVLVRLANTYDLDIADMASGEDNDLFSSLADAFADPIFQKAGVTREDAHELAAGNPVLAEAVAGLFRAWRQAQNELIDARVAGRLETVDPVEEARAFIQANRNYFPDLDAAGEAVADEIGHEGLSPFDALARRFNHRHGITVRVLPDDVMVGAYRRLNRHSGELLLSERLDLASRNFHLALQLCLIEMSATLDRAANDGRFSGDAGRRLARAALANYAAAATLMPYGRFHAAAKELRYDIEAIARRLGVSFEQTAHRLATLRRPGQEGVPFFFIRIDPAGNVSKRYSGDVFPFARYGGSCPIWNVHDAFRNPRRLLTQIIQLPEGSTYFSIARTVRAEAGGYAKQPAERVVALGCRIEDATDLIYADGIDLNAAEPTPIGITCRLCERPDCAARAHPPLRRRLVVDEYRRLSTPFSFEFN